ncbi:MAG TPA: hypothetical protein VFF04_06915, partial [Candidatus Babeliales bacterium]|nr:hypothetical protein [Candidatus Babeliales bacterium]
NRSCLKQNRVYRKMRWLYGVCFALENFNAQDDAHVKDRNIRKKSKRSKSQAKRMHLSQGLIEFDNGENYIFLDENLLNKECISDWWCLQKCLPGTHCCSKFWCCQCKCSSKKIPTRAEAFQAEETFYKQRRAREKELKELRAKKDAALAEAALAKDVLHAPAPQMMDAPASAPAVPTSLAAAAALTPALSSAHAKKDSQQKSVSFALPKTDSGTQTSPLGPVSLPGTLEVDAMPDAQPQQKQLRVATDSAAFFVPQGSSPAARKLPALPVVPRLPLAPDAVTPSQGQHGSPAHSFRLPHFNGGFTFIMNGKSVYEVTPAQTPAHHSKQSPVHSPLATSGSGRQAITIKVSSDDVLTVEKHSSKPSCSLTVDSAQGREHLPGLVEQAEPERPKSAASHHSLLSEASEA